MLQPCEIPLPPISVKGATLLAAFDVDSVFACLSQGPDAMELHGRHVNVNNLKFKTFARDQQTGCACSGCGLSPTHFVLGENHCATAQEYSGGFLNLYAVANGEAILFTHDHTMARALGGADNLSNTTTMCEPCNALKSVYEGMLSKQKAAVLADYFQNTLNTPVSLRPSNEVVNRYDMNTLDVSHLSKNVFLSWVFNTQQTFTTALTLLSSSQNMGMDEYLSHCNNEGQRLLLGTRGYVPFPFAKHFYPTLSRPGVQFLRLEIARRLMVSGAESIHLAPTPAVFYDDGLDICLLPSRSENGQKMYHSSDVRKLFVRHPQLLARNTLWLENKSVTMNKQWETCLEEDTWLVVGRKNGDGLLRPWNNGVCKTTPSHPTPIFVNWGALQLGELDGCAPKALYTHPVYIRALREVLCWKHAISPKLLSQHCALRYPDIKKNHSLFAQAVRAAEPDLSEAAIHFLAINKQPAANLAELYKRMRQAQEKHRSQRAQRKKQQRKKRLPHF